MIAEPKIRNNTCLTSHPEGCSLNVRKQIEFVKAHKPVKGFGNALIIGSSTGYGLASRITAAFGSGANTLGIAFEKPGTATSTGTAGWHHTEAFDREAETEGIYARSINADAFSRKTKEMAGAALKDRFGKVDLVIYSLAAPRRMDPDTGQVYASVIKPIGGPVRTKTLDLLSARIIEKSIEPATKTEIRETVKVMGGEDWLMWVEHLADAGLLAEGVQTVAFSYIGPPVTHPFYRTGTLGKAKEHLEATARILNQRLQPLRGRAFVSVNKAVVTRASIVIPAVPLYIAILYRIMKERGLHEGCIEQAYRLFADYLLREAPATDREGRIRLDDREMRADVQRNVRKIWKRVDTGNVTRLADVRGVQEEFYRFFGFRLPAADHTDEMSETVRRN